MKTIADEADAGYRKGARARFGSRVYGQNSRLLLAAKSTACDIKAAPRHEDSARQGTEVILQGRGGGLRHRGIAQGPATGAGSAVPGPPNRVSVDQIGLYR